MRTAFLHTLACTSVLFVAGSPQAQAAAARTSARAPAGDGRLERADGSVQLDAADAQWAARPPGVSKTAFVTFEKEVGKVFATWHPRTNLPHRLLLSGVSVPGSQLDPAVAQRFAADFLSRHLDLLAPGATAADFVLVSNTLSGGIRSLGFAQHHHGAPVIGGQISLHFKVDRLVMVGSDAFPHVHTPSRSLTAAPDDVRSAAQGWIAADVRGTTKPASTVEGPFVLPQIDAAGHITYAEVFRTQVRAEHPASAWDTYVAADTGAPVARRQTLMFGSSDLVFNVPVRQPGSTRSLLPAPSLIVPDENGGTLLTDNAGVVDYPGATLATTLRAAGRFAAVENAQGENAQRMTTLSDGQTDLWFNSTDELVDAQLTAYIHAMRVRGFVTTLSDVEWLQQELPITVNIDDTCNAFSDGNSINFFASGGGCENTGLLADVIYHEFGHSIHSQSIIEGVGQFNTSLSEGISDYLSATLTGDSGLARGFFSGEPDEPLRELNPDGLEYRWPEDRGEVHDEGRIIGGALWDLRTLMIEKLGDAEGRAYTDQLWYETTRRAVDIPSMYPQALLFDDDDGDLTNGTPNACEINDAYGAHGLFNAGRGNELVSLAPDDKIGRRVQLELAIPSFPDCPVSAATELHWRVRGSAEEFVVPMDGGANNVFGAYLPYQSEGVVVEYQVHVNYSNGTQRSLPNNIVDPWYQTFFGEVVTLQCLDLDAGFGTSGNWVVGPYQNNGGATGPTAPYADIDHVYQPDAYSPFTDSTITFDAVPTAPYSRVRLQMQRWLSVEDGFFDQAEIRVNGSELWSNFSSPDDGAATFHHVDEEWRFVDFDLEDYAGEPSIEVALSLRSDAGLEFSGWAVASACIVALADDVAVCGDGVFSQGIEGCDDGNTTPGDGCDELCEVEPGGTDSGDDSGDDSGPGDGSGSDGSGDDSESGSDTDTDGGGSFDGDGLLDRGCACSSDGDRGPSGPAGMLLFFGGLALLRRRQSSGERRGAVNRRRPS